MSTESKPDVVQSMGKHNARKNNRRNVNQTPMKTKFEGEIPEMKGQVYDCIPNHQADQYMKTTRVLANYFVNTHANSGQFRNAILNLELPEVPPIPRPNVTPGGPPLDEFDKLEYIEAVRQRNKEMKDNQHLNMHLYTAVWSQCSNTMRERIENLANYADFNSRSDGIALLQAIKSASYNYIETTYKVDSINEAAIQLLNCRQTTFMTPQEYFEQFKIRQEVYEQVGGNPYASPGTLAVLANEQGIEIGDLTDNQRAGARELELAALFIRNADKGRYSGLQASLKNDFLCGNNNNPATLVEAYGRLVHWKDSSIRMMTSNANDGIAFTTNGNVLNNEDEDSDGAITLAINGHSSSNKGKKNNRMRKGEERATQANKDDKKGDKDDKKGDNDEAGRDNNKTSNSKVNAYSSPTLPMSSSNVHTIIGHIGSNVFHTSSSSIPRSWILLDNQSTVDVFCEPSLLNNIVTTDDTMIIQCNAGTITSNQKGIFQDYGEVWFCKNGIANILSFANARKKGCTVTYNFQDDTFILEQPNGNNIIFNQSPNGLYYHDAIAQSIMLVNTVQSKKEKYSHRDYLRAKEARELMCKIGRPSLQQFLTILDRNLLPNCPVTRRDAILAENIFGPDLGSLKGKTVRKPSEPVQIPMNDLPMDIMQQYQNVTLCGDIMFVNKIPFFVTISRHIHFGTVEMIANRRMDTIQKSITAVVNVYKQRGFNITHILLDGEFEPLRGNLAAMGIQMNLATHDEHVPEAERFIRTLKDRVRCVYNMLPFDHMPPRIIIEMVKASNFWLNAFPYQNGISDILSPRQIVTGSTINYNHHCTLAFGTYVQTHEAHDNTMAPRTTGALALRPTGNTQGGFYFYSLSSGRLISRNRWTELPMPAEVIERVHTLARRANAACGPLAFLNRYGIPLENLDNLTYDTNAHNIDGDVDDTSYPTIHDNNNYDADPYMPPAPLVAPENIDIYDIDPDLANTSLDDENNLDHHHDDISQSTMDDNVDINDHQAGQDDENNDVGLPGVNDFNNNDVSLPGVNDANNLLNDVTGDNVDEYIATLDEQMDSAYGPRTDVYNLRPRRPRTYEHLFTQHSVKQGLRIFGQAGTNAVIKELKQLHDLKVIVPVDPSTLSTSDKHGALQYLMFLKQKRCGKIKGRGCADGRKQRLYLSKEDTSSPTVAIESVYLSCVIDADENRDVATVDIPGAFLHADMDDTVYLRIDGDMALMLTNLAPSLYKPYLDTTKNKSPALYVLLKKALYGTLQAALLFWEKLSGLLISWGFVINPYDRCVANKHINGSICTILWHVDDLKISHIDPAVVTEIIQQLSDQFGAVAPLTIHRGKQHDYLGMQLDFSIPSKIRITMIDYINKIFVDCPSDMNGTAPTPAGNHLFMVNTTNPLLLPPADADLFHHIVAQLLFLCKRARPDIQTAVSFLCTRVQHPDSDDYKKLTRVIKYLRNTISLPLTLEASDMKLMQWWVDASYGVHHDMKSHTGGLLSLGKGAIYATSTRQKLNTKSSTEAELVGINDVIPQALWTKYFLQEQGYDCGESIIYQDNQSAILLENNGRASSSKRTRHINIRYYFVTDKIKSNEVRIEYCPTESMIADFFTKPLQGHKFTIFRDFILNIDHPNAITLCNLTISPISLPSGSGCSLIKSHNHRSVLDGRRSETDWSFVTRQRRNGPKSFILTQSANTRKT